MDSKVWKNEFEKSLELKSETWFLFDLPKELSKSTVRPRGEFPIALAEVLDGW